jgi:membrane protein
MIERVQTLGRAIKRALVDTIQHDGIEHAGYMAFLSLLSFFPFLVFLMALASALGEDVLVSTFVQLLQPYLPDHVQAALAPRAHEILSGPPQSLMTLAIVGAIWTASSAVEGMRTILNRVYRITVPPPYIWRRLLSVVQFFLITGVIIIALSILIVLPLVVQQFGLTTMVTSWFNPFWTNIRYGAIGLTLMIGIAWMYLMLPNRQLRLIQVLPGAVIVTISWMIFGVLFSTYLSNVHQVHIIYGSLAGVIASLLFFYILNILFIYGAEFNYALFADKIQDRPYKNKTSIRPRYWTRWWRRRLYRLWGASKN